MCSVKTLVKHYWGSPSSENCGADVVAMPVGKVRSFGIVSRCSTVRPPFLSAVCLNACKPAPCRRLLSSTNRCPVWALSLPWAARRRPRWRQQCDHFTGLKRLKGELNREAVVPNSKDLFTRPMSCEGAKKRGGDAPSLGCCCDVCCVCWIELLSAKYGRIQSRFTTKVPMNKLSCCSTKQKIQCIVGMFCF